MSPRFSFAVRSLAEAIFAGSDGPPSKARLDFTETEFCDVIAHSGFRMKFIFGTFLFIISVVAPLLIFRLPSAWSLPLKDRIRAISKMEENAVLAAPVLALKAILCIAYYEAQDVAGEVGVRDLGFTRNEDGSPVQGRLAS